MKCNELIAADYARSRQVYSNAPPQILGRLTLSQEAATILPVDLGEIYTGVSEAIDENPATAAAFARTFGMLNVSVALDPAKTTFSFDRIDGYKPPMAAEIETSRRYFLPELLRVPETDSPTAYLLASGKPVTAELGLIQALHMVDTALVTGQYQPGLPLVRTIEPEELLSLRASYPEEVLLRLYGNVRGLRDVPDILGSVIPTALLEKSGVVTDSLDQIPDAVPVPPKRESICLERSPAAFIGITTAKKPHIGHGFLLAKAIAAAGKDGRVFVELNDSGPRVEQAVARLAAMKGIDALEAAEAVSNGTYGIEEVQQAYVSRDETATNSAVPPFSLAGPNSYYRDLLARAMPRGISCVSVADSELGEKLPGLSNMPGYIPLFGGSGMSLLRDERNAVVTERGGKYTLAGILGTISTRYALRLIDSPPPLTGSERTIFKNAGLAVEQDSGTGITIDFRVASGTNGTAVPLEDLLQIIQEKELSPRLLLPACRAMLNAAYFLPGEGASLNANYAGREAAARAFKTALDTVAVMGDPEALLYAPMKFVDRKRDIVRSMLAGAIGEYGFSVKPTPLQVKGLIGAAPPIAAKLSSKVRNYASSAENDRLIPKSNIEEQDRKIFQVIASAMPDPAIRLLLDVASEDKQAFDSLVSSSQLPDVLQTMGYEQDNIPGFLRKLQSVKGVFTI